MGRFEEGSPLKPDDVDRFTYVRPPIPSVRRITCMVHLPQIDFQAVDAEQLRFCVLGWWRFEDWMELCEGLAAFGSAKVYGEAGQSFVGFGHEGQWQGDEIDCERLAANGRHIAGLIWFVCLLTYGRFTVHPNCSSTYVQLRENNGRLRVARYRGFGELDCLRLAPKVKVLPDHLPALRHNAELVRELAENGGWQVLDHLVSPFQLALSEEAVEHRWTDFVANLDALFNPEGRSPLRRNFVERLSSRLAADEDERAYLRQLAEALYDYRSEAFHGLPADVPAALRDVLTPSNYPFPVDLIRKLTRLVARTTAGGAFTDYADGLIRRLAGDEAAAGPAGPTPTPTPMTIALGDRAEAEGAAIHHLVLNVKGPSEDLKDRIDAAAAKGEVTEFSTQQIRTTFFGPGANDFGAERTACGRHFQEIAGPDVVAFVPMPGLTMPRAHYRLEGGRELFTIDFMTWNTLQSAWARDVYGPAALFAPQSYLLQRISPAGQFADDKEALAFARGLLEPGTAQGDDLRNRVLAFQLGLMMPEPGALADPADVAWNVTVGNHRFSSRSRFSFFSWVPPQIHTPRWRLTDLDGRRELDEIPLMAFAAPGLDADEEAILEADGAAEAMLAKSLFALPEFRSVAQSYCRSRSTTLSTQSRLVLLFTTFERCFGSFSIDTIERTHARLVKILGQLKALEDIPDAAEFGTRFRHARNAVAHGRLPDREVLDSVGSIDLAQRLFFNIVATGPWDYAGLEGDRPKAFRRLRRACFDEA